MNNLIVVHGSKALPSGKISSIFLERLKEAVRLTKNASFDLIIISGGKTSENGETEAEMGLNYIKEKVSIPVILENKSKTTSENIRYVKDMLDGEHINKISVISSKKVFLRIRYLYSKLWPKIYPRIDFKFVKDSYPVFIYFFDLFFLLFAVIDPYEKFFGKITNSIFRNS